jgi:hypothetical protein
MKMNDQPIAGGLVSIKQMVKITLIIVLTISLFFNLVAHTNNKYNERILSAKDKGLDLCINLIDQTCINHCILTKVYDDVVEQRLTNMEFHIEKVCYDVCNITIDDKKTTIINREKVSETYLILVE